MAYFLFQEKYQSNKVKASAISIHKGGMLFAKYLSPGIETLANVELEPTKNGFIVRPKFNLVMSVSSLHKGNQGCCRILFARKDRHKLGGEKLGFAKQTKANLLAQFCKVNGNILSIPTGLRHILVYSDEIVVGDSLAATFGGFIRKTALFEANNPLENEAHALFVAA